MRPRTSVATPGRVRGGKSAHALGHGRLAGSLQRVCTNYRVGSGVEAWINAAGEVMKLCFAHRFS